MTVTFIERLGIAKVEGLRLGIESTIGRTNLNDAHVFKAYAPCVIEAMQVGILNI